MTDDRELQNKVLSSKVYPSFFPMTPSDRVLNIGCGEGPQAVVYRDMYGFMVGVDINADRLVGAKKMLDPLDLPAYAAVCADVENLPLAGGGFDKAIAIDIVEHVHSPDRLCGEVHRLLREDGELLITFPRMYEFYRDLMSLAGGVLRTLRLRKPAPSSDGVRNWDPDEHHHRHSLNAWIKVVEGCGFRFTGSRATTLFPPLYLVGIPRFWYSVPAIYRVDRFFSRLPLVKRLGQTMLCRFRKM